MFLLYQINLAMSITSLFLLTNRMRFRPIRFVFNNLRRKFWILWSRMFFMREESKTKFSDCLAAFLTTCSMVRLLEPSDDLNSNSKPLTYASAVFKLLCGFRKTTL